MAFVIDSSELMTARDLLTKDDVVAIPTETVYGLAASIDSDIALKKVFSLKERPFFDPLIVHVSSFEQAHEVTREFPPVADFLARWFWPGPLTLVLPKSDRVSSLITSGLDTVAVRFPAHRLAIDLINLVGTPLAAPSANRFGRTSPSSAAHVRAEFPKSDLFIVDGGPCQVGLESTVVSFAKTASGDDQIRILRPGGVSREALERALERWSHTVTVVRAESSESPGHLKHHYMPDVPLVIVTAVPTSAVLKTIADDLELDQIPNHPLELEFEDDAAHAARTLYSGLRSASEAGADLIFVIQTPSRTGGLWSAVWDRLTRAASWTPTERSRL